MSIYEGQEAQRQSNICVANVIFAEFVVAMENYSKCDKFKTMKLGLIFSPLNIVYINDLFCA
jgi:hypothetical protein